MTTLPPADRDRLEQILGLPVPEPYLELLGDFPRKLRAELTRRGSDDEQPLFRDVSTVIAQNEAVREEDIWTEEGPWPADHLVIGSEIGGDLFSLHAATKPAVYRLLHESGTFERVGTLRTYLAAVRRWLRGDAATITDALERRGRKKQAKEPAWVTSRRRQAAQAAEQERLAQASEGADGWGDATLFYQWKGHIADALRCCDTWIERSEDRDFPLHKRLELLDEWRDLARGQQREYLPILDDLHALFPDLAALEDAMIETAERALAEAQRRGDEDDVQDARERIAYTRKLLGR